VGAVVSLSDGRIAVVKEQNKKDINRPRVEVVSPKDKKEMVDLLEEKENLKIDHALNSFKDGKKYLDLI
jgi:hypothetical protein